MLDKYIGVPEPGTCESDKNLSYFKTLAEAQLAMRKRYSILTPKNHELPCAIESNIDNYHATLYVNENWKGSKRTVNYMWFISARDSDNFELLEYVTRYKENIMKDLDNAQNKSCILPIKKKWFEMILSGEKKEEYREIKPYWTTRLSKIYDFKYSNEDEKEIVIGNDARIITFQNGYGKNAPKFTALCCMSIKTGEEKWGAEPGVKYYTFRILQIISIFNI